MVGQLIYNLPAAAAADAATQFCFDCPTPASISEALAVLAGVSILIAVPGFFFGMLVHRKLSRLSLPGRLTIVALSVPSFWYLFLAAVATGRADADGGPFLVPLERMLFLREFLVGGIVVAVLASSLDARRARAAQSDGYYSRH